MLLSRFASLLGVAIAWYGYHANSVSLFGCGLALVPGLVVLRWLIGSPQRDAPAAPAASATPAAPVSAAEPPQPVLVVDRAIAAAELVALINAARQQRIAQ